MPIQGMFTDSLAAAGTPVAAKVGRTKPATTVQLGVPVATSVGRTKTASTVSATTAARPGGASSAPRPDCAFDPKKPFSSAACVPPAAVVAPPASSPPIVSDPAKVAPVSLPVASPPIVAPLAPGLPEHWLEPESSPIAAPPSPAVTGGTFGGSASVTAPDWAWIGGAVVALLGIGWVLHKKGIV